jgi:hypothetical protein
MKKIERLRWIERVFGPEYVSPYVACYTWDEITSAICGWKHEKGWSVRTDTRNGTTQGLLCPFLFEASLADVYRIWRRHGDALVYIVCGRVQPVMLQGVGMRLDDEHVFFEINDQEPMIAQRHMYDRPENLRSFVVGHGGGYFWNGRAYRSHEPEDVWRFGLDIVYSRIMEVNVPIGEEVTFSVLPDRSIVIW